MRRALVAGNWKMYKTLADGLALAQAVRDGVEQEKLGAEVVLVPPFVLLHGLSGVLRGGRVGLGAQNMHWEKEGAFTGEISPPMLKDAGCTHVVLGHSERRHIFGETDDGVGRKARAALDHGLVPIVCVGEQLAERESSRTFEVVERQLERGLRALTPDEVAARVVVAYEPVWAIGTGKTASPEQAQEVHEFLRRRIAASHGDTVAPHVRILYGGSVKPDNAAALIAQPDVDGSLVGGACLKADSFLAIIRAAS
jgi:triosephosphate isomerase